MMLHNQERQSDNSQISTIRIYGLLHTRNIHLLGAMAGSPAAAAAQTLGLNGLVDYLNKYIWDFSTGNLYF